jgi:hypothetical protein
LLTLDYETPVGTFCHRQRDFRQAVSVAAVCAREMGMALTFGTVVCQLVMLRSFVQHGLMNKPNLKQAFKGSVNRDLIEVLFTGEPGDLFLAQRLSHFDQYLEYGHSAPGAVKLYRLEHAACLRVQICPGHCSLQFAVCVSHGMIISLSDGGVGFLPLP